MNVSKILSRETELAPASSTPRLDLELLLCHVLKKPRSYLFAWPDAQISNDQQQKIESLIDLRKKGHPVAHLTGSRDFWSLELKVTPDTLIPRPETELLVEQSLKLLGASPRKVLDLGTGTGAIALALASERPDWQVTGCDKVPEAIALAKENRQRNQLERVHFYQSDWFCDLPGDRYDLIVSNPPYIEENDIHLQQGDVRFEPSSALTSGKDGLDDIRIICAKSPVYLNTGGWLLLEHGYDQGEAVREIFSSTGFQKIQTLLDLAGHDRVTRGCKP